MSIALLQSTLPGAPAAQPTASAQAATAAGDDPPATFAATLDRSRLAIATEAREPAVPGAPARKRPREHGSASDADALSRLLASAAIAAPLTPAAPRTGATVVVARAKGSAPVAARSDAAVPDTGLRRLDAAAALAGAAAPEHTDPKESPAHERFTLPASPAGAADAAGTDRAVAPRPSPAATQALAPSDALSPRVALDAAAGPADPRPGSPGTAAHGRSFALPPAAAPDPTPTGPADAGAATTPLGAFAARVEADEGRPAAPADAGTGLAAIAAATGPGTNTAAPAPSAPNTVSPPVGSSEWGPALAQQIVHLGGRASEIQLDLHPAELGPLTVKLSLGDAQAQVMFVSEHAAVRQALEAALPQLRATLADSGISLGQATVGSNSQGGGQPATAGGGHGAGQRQPAPEVARPLAPAPAAPTRAAATRAGLDTFA